MKKCTYCGKEYPDTATVCAIDAEPLRQIGAPGAASSPAQDAPRTAPITAEEAFQAAARRDMVTGGVWCGGGILITLLTYSAASSSRGGGSYFVAWGAIIFGGIQFIRGFTARNRSRGNPHASTLLPSTGAPDFELPAERKPWTCAVCGEQSEGQFSSCWKCNRPRSDTN